MSNQPNHLVIEKMGVVSTITLRAEEHHACIEQPGGWDAYLPHPGNPDRLTPLSANMSNSHDDREDSILIESASDARQIATWLTRWADWKEPKMNVPLAVEQCNAIMSITGKARAEVSPSVAYFKKWMESKLRSVRLDEIARVDALSVLEEANNAFCLVFPEVHILPEVEATAEVSHE